MFKCAPLLAIAFALGLLTPAAPAQASDSGFQAELVPFATNFCRRGTIAANGAEIQIRDNVVLFSLLGTEYGGNGRTTLKVPNIKGLVGSASGLTWCVVEKGSFPGRSKASGEGGSGELFAMSASFCPQGYAKRIIKDVLGDTRATWCQSVSGDNEAKRDERYLSQLVLWSGARCPRHSLPADGSVLAINSNQSLYALLGTNFGGDGRTTFALPKLSPPARDLNWCVVTIGLFPSRF